ncbi:hypothetical protein EYF80_037828 [Liparis tanakae]|uniref:Uncharacterized protein n=1 Tax=Liparis tanakae TaxID=230148 RepID=A0A4Z2GEJ8_9TELE|nr:hypothetical protein EYF80_037828 [Liparis tanakae]
MTEGTGVLFQRGVTSQGLQVIEIDRVGGAVEAVRKHDAQTRGTRDTVDPVVEEHIEENITQHLTHVGELTDRKLTAGGGAAGLSLHPPSAALFMPIG